MTVFSMIFTKCDASDTVNTAIFEAIVLTSFGVERLQTITMNSPLIRLLAAMGK